MGGAYDNQGRQGFNLGGQSFSVFAGAGGSHSTGLVPDPGATAHTPPYLLAEDATWKSPASLAFVAAGGSAAAGMVPSPGATAHPVPYLLAEDGTWKAQTGSGVRCYNSADQTISNNTNTAITFDTEDTDTDGYHSTSSNTSRITIPTGFGGLYLIGGSVQFAANSTGGRRLRIQLNGSQLYGTQDDNAPSATLTANLAFVTALNLADGDYVELVVLQTSGGNLNVQADSSTRLPNFWAARIK